MMSHRERKSWIDWLGVELSAVSTKEKMIATLGGFVSILLLILISERSLHLPHSTALVASMGASAVLLFAVPHGQLSQPWPLAAGHVISALIGVTCARWIPQPEIAAAAAVGFSIGAMHQFKCIHPPGGATALTAVLGGASVHDLGYRFVYCPVLINVLVIVGVGVAFNYFFHWRRYPSALTLRATPTDIGRNKVPSHEEIMKALKSLDSFVDISEADLIALVTTLGKKPRR